MARKEVLRRCDQTRRKTRERRKGKGISIGTRTRENGKRIGGRT
jgi:hypothetical protein